MSIHKWPKSERPREKLLNQGAHSLSNTELLAIFFRTGVKGKSAVELAREALTAAGCLRNLIDQELSTFSTHIGLGQAKYVQLKAALELGKRYLQSDLQKKPILNNTKDTKNYLCMHLGALSYELFGLLLLNSNNQLIKNAELFKGTVNEATIYPRIVVKTVLSTSANKVILYHNHTSGDITPSSHDLQVTKYLKGALKLVDVEIIDHIIIGANKALSFTEQSLL